MPECPVEQAQTQILIMIAEQGDDAVVGLCEAFRNDETKRAAIKGLVFEGRGAFRRIALDAIGMAGDSGDVENVLMHLLGHEKVLNKKKYTKGLCNFGDRLLPYHADKDEWVRTSALAAVEMILMREESARISPETERVLVRCMFMDPSENAGKAAARILSANSSIGGFNFFFMLLGNAEKMKNAAAMQRGEKALANMIGSMKEKRVRGSFLIPLIRLCEGSERIWGIAEDAIAELFESSDMKKEIQNIVFKEKLKRIDLDRENDDMSIPLQRINRAIKKIGEDNTSRIKGRKKKMTAEAELKEIVPPAGVEMGGEIVPPPKQLVRAPDDWDYDKVIISRGPVVDALCAAGRKIKMAFRGAKGPRR